MSDRLFLWFRVVAVAIFLVVAGYTFAEWWYWQKSGLVLFGVMGGVLAFGFVGLFIGPTLLAVGFSLMQEWATREHLT